MAGADGCVDVDGGGAAGSEEEEGGLAEEEEGEEGRAEVRRQVRIGGVSWCR